MTDTTADSAFGSNSSGNNFLYFNLKGKVDESTEPYFAQSEKVEGKWKDTKTFDTMAGMIVGASIDEKEFKPGEGKKKIFILILENNGQKAKLALTHNQVTYGIINSLASCIDTISTFSIKVYRDKPAVKENKTYYNGKSFVLRNNAKTEWQVRMQDAPKKKPVLLEGGVQYIDPTGKPVFDATEVHKFWEGIFTTCILAKVGAPAAQSSANAGAAGANNSNTATFTASSQEDDLPF